jgi:hypothetical protein
MLKNEDKYWLRGALPLVLILGAMLSGCGLDSWLTLEPGMYGPTTRAMTTGAIETLEVDRENQLATFRLVDGSRIVVSFSARDRADWPSGCPANIGSSTMEVLDIAEETLVIAGLRFDDPILVRDCPAEPEQIALRENGLVGGGGSACANTSKCLHFARQPEVTAVLTAAIVNAKPLPSSMKGYELYSWYDEERDSWRFTLITGTNRLKTVEEIIAEENQVTQSDWAKITAIGTEALKALLNRLPSGTELFWLDEERLEGAPKLTANITLPEASVVKTIENHCRRLDIQLHASQ